MSLLQKVVRLAASPQGRRAVSQARAKLDTRDNRERLSQAVDKIRSARSPRPKATERRTTETDPAAKASSTPSHPA